MLSRSFKYHRPRGILSMTGADANYAGATAFEPNVAADRTPITEGLRVSAQNVNGSLERDRDAIIDRLGAFCRSVSTTAPSWDHAATAG